MIRIILHYQSKLHKTKFLKFFILFLLFQITSSYAQSHDIFESGRQRISINNGWKFYKYAEGEKTDDLIYDVRPEVKESIDGKAADAKPTEALKVESSLRTLKPWILPTGNSFIGLTEKKHIRPEGNPGGDFSFVQNNFNDDNWENITLPHDWAIKGPFYKGNNAIIGGGMGRLPIQGVAWYRKKINIPLSDKGKSIFLDIDGAMSYAMVWINGKIAGGWPNGYTSWQLDITPYIIPGQDNQIAIRLDNPISSSRWYPGAGIYRNVWLTKTNPVYVENWGTAFSTRNVSTKSAIIDFKAKIINSSTNDENPEISTEIYFLNNKGVKNKQSDAKINPITIAIKSQSSSMVSGSVTISNPKLWGPQPDFVPNRYTAITTISIKGKIIDTFETQFGIRDIQFDAEKGLFVNGKPIYIKGVNQHHDLGALGTAFNVRAAQRQLEILRELGCNAIRMSHNPPAPELLELTDKMGFLVIDETFDCWELKKNPLDMHLIFPDWSEQDLRALIRRDRNHPSIIVWSFGNEVGEQYTDTDGAAVAKKLKAIIKEEDTTRPTTVAMNYAKPNMPLPEMVDLISLNYQGEGIRNSEAYAGLKGISTSPLFPAFHEKFPKKAIISSENAAAVSSRGEYFFPVYHGNSAPIKDGFGGDSKKKQVSSYELYSVDFGSSADKVFASMEKHPYVAGGFAWSGWDYLGEPTPYYLSRSSYFGIIDLAGFKKDRYYLYQSQWRSELPMAHILPHWNWPDRIGQITPVHIFTSGDEAELFLNGKSLGRKKMEKYEYRLRWDDVIYTPGELKVVAYKNNKKWAENLVRTAGEVNKIQLSADHSVINADGDDLSFVTIEMTDRNGIIVPQANNTLHFSIEGSGEIIATDNGNPADMTSFASLEREAFNGLCLVIIRAKKQAGKITLKVKSEGLKEASISIKSIKNN
jgi:beta-galactosidase